MAAAILLAGLASCGGGSKSDGGLVSAPEFAVVKMLAVAKRTTPKSTTTGPAILATSVGAEVVGISLPTERRRVILEFGSSGDPVRVRSPSWAPDGRSFVVSAETGVGHHPRVVVKPVQGGRGKTIAGGMFDPAPRSVVFSPDGRYLVAPAEHPHGSGLYAYDLRRGRAQQVVAGPVAPASSVSWSPDGRRVALDRDGGGIVVIDLRSRDARLLTRDGAGAAWSPDGRWIAFATPRGVHARRCGEDDCGPTTDIDVLHPDGSGRRRVTRTQGDEATPSWSPDSKWLVAQLLPGKTYYEENSYLVILTANGSCYRRVGSGRREVLEVGANAWRPGARAVPRC